MDPPTLQEGVVRGREPSRAQPLPPTPVSQDTPAALDRPHLARRLAGAGLDVRFDRAEGCWLEHEVDGRRRRVLDLVGGFGAAFLGHGPPAVLAAARAALDDRTPFLGQASSRPWTEELARRLCARASSLLGGSWVSHILSTGSEAVDAAARHALALRACERRAFRRRLEGRLHGLRGWLDGQEPHVVRAFLEAAERLSPALACLADPADLEARLRRLAADVDRARPRFLAVAGAYHGSTLGAAALGAGPGAAAAAIPVTRVSRGDPGDLQRVLAEACLEEFEPSQRHGGWILRRRSSTPFAAFFLEPVQGEGGVHPIAPQVLREWAALASAHGLPVVADEIQAGLGRCGAFFAIEGTGLHPQALLLGKTLGGGVAKVSAVLFQRDRYVEDFALHHGSTFGGDDPSSRVALAALDLIEEGSQRRIRHARRLGAVLLEGLRRLQHRWPGVIREVRGQGLLLGLELAPQERNPSVILRGLDESGQLAAACAGWLLWQEGIRVAPMLRAGRVLRLEPPVCTPPAELRRALTALDRLCALLQEGAGSRLLAFLRGPAPRPQREPERLLLDAARERWRSTVARPAGLPLGPPPAPALPGRPRADRQRVAFLCHWIDPPAMRFFAPELGGYSDRELARLSARAAAGLPSMRVQDLVVTSATGREVECRILGWMALPGDLLRVARGPGRSLLLDSIHQALDAAQAQGCRIAGFGGFTSVVTRAGLLGRHAGIAVTTGNALTLGMALQALEPACVEQGLDLGAERVAVVGAAGNIGQLAARLLQPRVGALALVGHPRQRRELEALAGAMAAGGRRPLVLTDLAGIRGMRVIFSATNVPRPILDERHCSPGPGVLLDLAVPGDAAPDLARTRPRWRVIRGGVVRLPEPFGRRIRLPGWHLPAGHVHACLAETLLLGLEGREGDFALGALRAAQVRDALAMAERHGFALGCPQTHATVGLP